MDLDLDNLVIRLYFSKQIRRAVTLDSSLAAQICDLDHISEARPGGNI